MTEQTRPVAVFLDTNALHYIHLYLQYAERLSLHPYSQQGENAIAESKEHLNGIEDERDKKALHDGLNILESLSNQETQIEYSRVSEIELIVGRAKGRALEIAAKEHIPDRMWTRFSENEIEARLTTTDLTEIRKRVEGLGPALEKAGIPVTESNERRTKDVLNLAKGIAGLVYLSMADSIIYASALVAGADYLITWDNRFRKTVNRIRSGGELHNEVKQGIQALVGKIILSAPGNVPLPEARKTLPHKHSS